MRILLGLVVLASGLTGALSYPEKNLVVAEAVSPPGAEPDSETQVRYAVVKGDREQVHEGAVRVASVAFDHPVRASYFRARSVLDDETFRLSLDDADVDPISHKRDVRLADLSTGSISEQPEEPPLSKEELCNTLSEQAQANALPAIYFANLIWQESRFRHDAVSPVGALGVAQFMPETAMASGVDDPFDPLQAIPASARLLHDLREQFGNLGLAAAAYNAGPGRVHDWLKKRRKLPRETRNYVLRVTGWPVEHWRAAPQRALAFAPARRLPCRDMPVFVEQQQEAAAQQDDAAPPTPHNAAATRSHLNLHRKSHRVRVAMKQPNHSAAQNGKIEGAKSHKAEHKSAAARHGTRVGATPTAGHRKPDLKKDARKLRKPGTCSARRKTLGSLAKRVFPLIRRAPYDYCGRRRSRVQVTCKPALTLFQFSSPAAGRSVLRSPAISAGAASRAY